MLPRPYGVELTKVHYYDDGRKDGNVSISTISREVCDNDFNRNVIIKRNVFGHRWVLKINEGAGTEKKRGTVKLVVYVLVFCSIVVAVCFGVFFSVEKNFFGPNRNPVAPRPKKNTENYNNRTHENQVMQGVAFKETSQENTTTNKNNAAQNRFCACDALTEVCLKVEETEKPKCVEILEENDPTGCGGLCPLDTHYCRALDPARSVYQCSVLRNVLRCPDETFNCGNNCVPLERRCDGVVHCSDFSDEKNCACDLNDNFQCGNSTSCLENSKKCDRKIDCWDKSDELHCDTALTCGNDEAQCLNGDCVAKEKFCDGTPDCTDKSDEPEGC